MVTNPGALKLSGTIKLLFNKILFHFKTSKSQYPFAANLVNKLGLSWAKLSSNWNWNFVILLPF